MSAAPNQNHVQSTEGRENGSYAPSRPLPPEGERCTGVKRDGSRCTLKRAEGYGDKCRAHGMSPEERTALSRAGVEARQRRAEERSDVVERGRKGLKALMAERLEERADVIVARLVDVVEHGTDADALRAAEVLMSRVYGRPVQPTEDLTPQRVPTTADEVRAMSPEERRALLALALPAHPNTASAQG